MDFEDNQLPGMTVLDEIGIKNDDNYEDSKQENLMATQGYGYHEGFNYSNDHHQQQHPSSSSLFNSGHQHIMEYGTIMTPHTRASMHRSLTNLELIKLEKKRERNRIAATKCRQRKMEKISTLEGQVKQLQKENGSLLVLSQRLRASVHNLESQINYHVRSGCQIAVQQPTPALEDRDEQQHHINGSNPNCQGNGSYPSNATPTASCPSNSPSPVQFGPDSTCLS